MTEIEDKSLLKCTIKKSVDVLEKVLVFGLGFVVGVAALWIACFIISDAVTRKPLVNLVSDTISVIWLILTSLGTILLAIPWYVYVGVIFIVSIMTYSFLWCIARELTDEDWKSDEAEAYAGFVFISFVTLSTFSAFFSCTQLPNSDAFTFVFGFALIFAFIATISIFVIKVYSFPGAYLHYRKRMKEVKVSN